jgi:hypothetical protein
VVSRACMMGHIDISAARIAVHTARKSLLIMNDGH